MRLKSLQDLFHYFKKRSIDHLLAAVGPQQACWAFSVTGGGTGTDAVLFASQSMGGKTCPNMADTSYRVTLGHQATPAAYVSTATKATTGFTILGLGAAEVIDVVVIGRADGMAAKTE